MFRIAPLFILLFILNTSVALCQDDLKIDFGSIISGTYKNSQSQVTPLQVNGGNGTFLSNWVMLIGAQINEKLAFYAEIQTVNGLRFINYGLSVIYQLDTDGLNQPGHTVLKIYNLMGQEVTTLVNENLPAGSYRVIFNAQDLPSGVYVYELQSRGFKQSRKMVFLK